MAYVMCLFLTCQFNSGGGTCDTERTPRDKSATEYCRRIAEYFKDITDSETI